MGKIKVKDWSINQFKKEAKKYSTRGMFSKGSSRAYSIALKKGILNEICSHMKKGGLGFTFDSVKKESLKYSKRSEFTKGSPKHASWCRRNGVLDEICSHMEMKKKKMYLNYSSVKAEALKYDTRNKFCLGSPNSYYWAQRKGFLDKICSHMKIMRKDWNLTLVKVESLKYNSRFDFRLGSPSAYSWAQRHKKLDEICFHMESKFIFWSVESAHKEAMKYDTRKSFSIGSPNAYKYATRMKILDIVCSHMIIKIVKHNKDEAIKISKKYKTRQELRDNNYKVYSYLIRKGHLYEGTKHMVPALSGFRSDKKGFTYYIRIDKEGNTVYKIGITNLSIKERFGKSQMEYITVLKIWEYENGADARKLETEILRDYSYAKYKGPDILKDGNSEMFIDDVLMLDKQNLEIA